MAGPILPVFPLLSMTTPQVLHSCSNLKESKNNTIFIASYPKSGTTWMQAIVLRLLMKDRRELELSHISQYAPFYEIEKTWDLEKNEINEKYVVNHNALSCRVFNTHLLWHMLPLKNESSSIDSKVGWTKYIYVVRDGKDVVLSFYHHLSNQDDADCFTGSFEDFLKLWCEGNLPYGKWIDHIKSWLEISENITTAGTVNENILFVRYQDLVANPIEEIVKIGTFIGINNINNQMVENEVFPFVSFEYMRNNQEKFMPISVPWKENYNFIRKGIVGDHLSYFDKNHLEIYNHMIENELMKERNQSESALWSRLFDHI
eukprot:gene4923-6889_t